MPLISQWSVHREQCTWDNGLETYWLLLVAALDVIVLACLLIPIHNAIKAAAHCCRLSLLLTRENYIFIAEELVSSLSRCILFHWTGFVFYSVYCSHSHIIRHTNSLRYNQSRAVEDSLLVYLANKNSNHNSSQTRFILPKIVLVLTPKQSSSVRIDIYQ